jgi:hypothetical protein
VGSAELLVVTIGTDSEPSESASALLVQLLADMRLKRGRQRGRAGSRRARPPPCGHGRRAAYRPPPWLRRPALQKHVNRGRLFACLQGPLELVIWLVMYATTPPVPDLAPDCQHSTGSYPTGKRPRAQPRPPGKPPRLRGARQHPRQAAMPPTANRAAPLHRQQAGTAAGYSRHDPAPSGARHRKRRVVPAADSRGPDSHDTPPGQCPQLTGISRARRPTVRRGRLAGPGSGGC